MAEPPIDVLNQLQPLIDTIRPFFVKASVIVGGVFGIYLLLLFVRVHYERKKVKILKDIRYDLDQMNMHNSIPFSKNKKGKLTIYFQKLQGYFKK